MGGESYARGLGRRDELAVILYPEHVFLASIPEARGCKLFVRDKRPIAPEIGAGDFGHPSFTREGKARKSDLLLILSWVTEADRVFLRRLGRLQQPLDMLEQNANLLVVLGHLAG